VPKGEVPGWVSRRAALGIRPFTHEPRDPRRSPWDIKRPWAIKGQQHSIYRHEIVLKHIIVVLIYIIYIRIYIYMFLIFHHYILRIMGQQYWTSKVDGLILNKLCDCGPIGAWILIHTHTIFTLICRGYRLSQINEAFQQATGWLGPHKSILTVETWGGVSRLVPHTKQSNSIYI
jgi:hypothetical protein